MFLQTIYHPLRLAAEKTGPVALDAYVECDTYSAEYRGLSAVPYLDVLATLDEKARKLFLSLVNLSKTEAQKVDVRMDGAEPAGTGLAHIIAGEAPEVTNDFGKQPIACHTEPLSGVSACFSYKLPPLAHVVLELEVR